MRFSTDFTNVRDEDEDPKPEPVRPLIPLGWWVAIIEAVEYKSSINTGEPYLQIKLSFPAWASHPDYREYLILSLMEKNLWRLRKFIKQVFGIAPSGMVQIDTDKWIGARALVKIEHERYNGQMRARVANFTYSGDDQ